MLEDHVDTILEVGRMLGRCLFSESLDEAKGAQGPSGHMRLHS